MSKEKANQLCVIVPNQPGMLAKVTQALSREGINIDCLQTEGHGDTAILKFLFDKENGAQRKLQNAGFQVLETQVFCLELPNRPGELNKLAKKLAEQEIDIRSLYATSHGSTTKLVLAVDQPEQAARIVKESAASLAASAY